ncbi:hypothetical protein BGZ54_009915 [Gamsiella multidivaricata]|nr:hypothetical protein BGZ54_009915 [Gamsiella multidivaricata]
MSKMSPSVLTKEQQYSAIEQTLTRAGYDHEARIDERPSNNHGSLNFSTLNSSHDLAGNGYYPADSSSSVVPGGEGTRIGGSNASGSLQICSPVSPGSASQRGYAYTVRSNTSSILSLGRQRVEPPVVILPHYNSPYEALYLNQSDVTHFVGKDLRIGTVCISMKQAQGVTHVLVRTVLRFANIDITDSYRSTLEFDQCRSLYMKKNGLLPVLHAALQQCFESIPEYEVSRHQVVRHQAGADHSVVVLDDPRWLQSPRYISSLVRGLEEIRHEGFSYVLKNLEAQMKPAALTLDIVVPNVETLVGGDKEKFWAFFNDLGDHIEPETYLPQTSTVSLNMPAMVVGSKTEEQRQGALAELIETEVSYNKRMHDLVNIYLGEARSSVTALDPPLGKYEIRQIFSNIEQIVTASTEFLKNLREYQSSDTNTLSLGDICRKNLQAMGCYKQYLMRYQRAQETHSSLTKKSPAYKTLQEKCLQTSGIQTLSNLLIEPTQRIVKYPLLFKEILSGTAEDSSDVEGLREAAEIASQIAHMEKAKPEQKAEMLFNLRSTIESCPDSLLSQNRSIITYLDGYETNLLTGESGRPITLILFSDKVMIVRRPKGLNGDVLFQLKEDVEAKKRKDKENKERREREKKHKKDGLRQKKEDKAETDGASASSFGNVSAGFSILRKDWKFMGWMDLLRLKVSVVEQTDPEGLFCITTRSHAETKDDPWQTTRGIMPLVLSKRDPFISKFYETLALAKSAAISNGPESTSRLHIAELELFCNVFTETQYRDFKFKGEVTLFYTTVPNHPVEVTPFSRLPQFVGMIQTSDYGLRAILRSKTSLHRIGGPSIAAEDSNQFLDADAFQVHISELLANLQWTAYSFNPYQSPHLHISRVYMDTDYLYKTASSFSKAATLKAKGLRKIRESAGILTLTHVSEQALPEANYSATSA